MSKPYETLKHRADFLATAASGFRFVKPTVTIQARKRPEGGPDIAHNRAGFTATKKLGGAVVRNRVKRRLRAAAAQLLPEFGRPGIDYVFIGRDATAKSAFADLIRDMKHALRRLSEIMG